MSVLNITDNRLAGTTLLPDDFVDYYMPHAHGEFVKVYLYLLRTAHAPETNPSLSAMADVFSCPEKDIIRALKYWQEVGLLQITEKNDEIDGITLLPVSQNLNATQQDPTILENKEEKPKPILQISSSRARELKSNDDVKELLFATSAYFGRPLQSGEMRRLLYFYDELNFPIDLIDYLVEYCIGKGKKDMNYIEKVGLSWSEEGMTTARKAKNYVKKRRDVYRDIFNAFGIRGRDPISEERADMDRWMKTYGFGLDIIEVAAARTVKKLGQANFPYAEGILSRWYNAGVRTVEDIAAQDEAHKNEQKNQPPKASSQHRQKNYANYDQRTDYDFDELERAALKQ
ncbi:MAG: DnaD domain protein [Eubacterium sp.]|nr:DnaD domain protein [Eubacterium sp.]